MPPGTEIATTKLVFENGTARPYTVDFGAAGQFEVPASARRTVSADAAVGLLTVSVTDADGRTTPLLSGQPQFGVYVYNHQGAYDYTIESQQYGEGPNIMGFINPDGPPRLRAPLFTFFGTIDYLFEEFPFQVEGSNLGFGITRFRLVHTPEGSPFDAGYERAATQVFTNSLEPLFLVRINPFEASLQKLGLSEVDQRNVPVIVLDGLDGQDLIFSVDGCDLGLVVATTTFRLSVPPGFHTLKVAVPGGETIRELAFEAKVASRYVWAPLGHREYRMEFDVYNSKEFAGLDLVTVPDSIDFRGLELFLDPTNLTFDPFPETVRASQFDLATTVSRLVRQRSSASLRDEVRADYYRQLDDACQVLVNAGLGGRVDPFKIGVQLMVGDSPQSDCDTWIMLAMMNYERGAGEEAVALYDRVLQVQKDNAKVYEARGYVHRSLDHKSQAAADFRSAVLYDPSRSTDLDPIIRELDGSGG
jgi:hypothetical protein